MAEATTEVSSLFVTLLGMGTTFFGLICIILLSMLMSRVCRMTTKKSEKVSAESSTATPVQGGAAQIPNRGEVVAAISAAVAEDMGKDVSSIKIHSIKKV